MHKKARFAGTVWWVVYEQNAHVSLTSLDGRQHKDHIHVSQIQYLDEFQDCYPEE